MSDDADERGKKLGMVGILWRVHNPPMPDAKLSNYLSRIWRCAPIRLVDYHMCYGSQTFLEKKFSTILLAWMTTTNFFPRQHSGGTIQVMYQLAAHGIPECLPLELGVETKIHNRDHLNGWMARRRSIDQDRREIQALTTSTMSSTHLRTSDVSASFHLNSLRTSDASVERILNSLRASGQSMQIDFPIDIRPSIGSRPSTESIEFGILEDTHYDMLIGGPPLPDDMSLNSGNDNPGPVNTNMNDVNESQPLDSDILFGQGRWRHEGNIWFRDLISQEYDEYNSGNDNPGPVNTSANGINESQPMHETLPHMNSFRPSIESMRSIGSMQLEGPNDFIPFDDMSLNIDNENPGPVNTSTNDVNESQPMNETLPHMNSFDMTLNSGNDNPGAINTNMNDVNESQPLDSDILFGQGRWTMNNLSNSPAPGSGIPTDCIPAKEVTSTTRSSDWSNTSLMLRTSIGSFRPSIESMEFEMSEDTYGMLIGDISVVPPYTSLKSGKDNPGLINTTSMNDVNESQPMKKTLQFMSCNEISSRDILLGQGRYSHEGNIWFRVLISENFDKYNSLGKRGKTELSTQIVAMIRNEGRRFYIREADNWVEMNDDEKARKKVTSHFRDERNRRAEAGATSVSLLIPIGSELKHQYNMPLSCYSCSNSSLRSK